MHALATAVQEGLSELFDVKLAPWRGDIHRPVVELHLRSGNGACLHTFSVLTRVCQAAVKAFAIRLLPVPSANTFDADKLLPQVNNCHRNSHPDEPQPGTPQYNSRILEDMQVLANLATVHETLATASGPLIDSLLLLKVRDINIARSCLI